jgi:hypothetical protein
MITRRGFLGSIAALVVGGGSALLHLATDAPAHFAGFDCGVGASAVVWCTRDNFGRIWVLPQSLKDAYLRMLEEAPC